MMLLLILMMAMLMTMVTMVMTKVTMLMTMLTMLMTMVTMLVFSGEPRVLPFARLRVGRGSSLEGEDALGCLTSESLHLVQGWFDFPQMTCDL